MALEFEDIIAQQTKIAAAGFDARVNGMTSSALVKHSMRGCRFDNSMKAKAFQANLGT